MIEMGSLLVGSAPATGDERVERLFAASGVRIERIVSNRHRSPDGYWYDQDDDEFVVVIAGEATLELADGRTKAMSAGDWLLIPAHTGHRILCTDERTIWLAIHTAIRTKGQILTP